jgi:PAS domain S-box-containing protein
MTRGLPSIRIQLPVTVALFVTTLLVLGLLGALDRTTRVALTSRARAVRDNATVIAELLADFQQHGDPADVGATFERLGRMADLRAAALVDAHGLIVAATQHELQGRALSATALRHAAALGEHARREVRAAEQWFPGHRFLMALPVHAVGGGAPGTPGRTGVFIAEFDFQPLAALIRAETYRYFITCGLVSLAALLLLGLFLNWRVARPAGRIAAAAARFATGDRAARVGRMRDDELGRVASAFDNMAAQVEAAEESLRRSERRFVALLEALPVGVLMADRATRTVLYANRRLQELCGVPSLPGSPLHALDGRRETDAGEIYPASRLPVERVLDEGVPVEVDDLVFVHEDGARIPAVTHALPMSIAGGPDFDAVVAVVQDRRDVEHAFEALRRSEHRFAALLEAMPVGVLMVDRATRTVLYGNRRLEELGGVPVEVGRPLHLLPGRRENNAGEDFPLERLPIERVLTEGRPVTSDDLVYVHPDGTRVQVMTTALPMSLSGTPGFDAVVAVVQDRRSLEHAFAEIRAWEQRFQDASQVTEQAVYEWDVLGDHVRFSDSFTSVFGYRAEEADSNVKWNALTHPDDLDAVRAEMQASLRARRTFDCVHRLRHKDGRWRWVRDRGRLRFDAAGRFVLMIGAVSDVTEQRELETRFRQAQKMQTVGTLAGGIAHDFNNQLTGVLGHLDLLREELPAGDPRLDHVRIAHIAAERCTELTRGLLAFSRMLRSDPRPTNVNGMLEETATLLRRVLPASIRIELVPAAGLLLAMVDPTQLQQILLNLCVNARDAMPEGGRLRLAAAAVHIADGAEHSMTATAGDFARIEVSDDGVGIEPDALERIFEPFYTTKPAGGGTGLGLSMVYGIVAQHRGWVDVESEPGRGATFRVHLPLATTSPASDQPATTSAHPANYDHRVVLVVDDEPVVRNLATALLERAGCKVIQAADGNEAVAQLTAHVAEVETVLLDLTMPGPPAREVVRQMRRVAPRARIVLTSGYAQEAAAVPEFAGLPFLQKPYLPARLYQLVCAPHDGNKPARA